jgi:peptide-methionine (S)-S-oxide reductase
MGPASWFSGSALLKTQSLPYRTSYVRWMDEPGQYQRATFAAGSFWDTEAAFRRLKGVVATAAGYAGGTVPGPTYELVSKGNSGHAEAAQIIFDPAVVSYEDLLTIFWEIHDPTSRDCTQDYPGSQYRSIIFFHDEEQAQAALTSRRNIQVSGRFGTGPIMTEIHPVPQFWPAEECHQQFYEKCAHGYCTSRQIDG